MLETIQRGNVASRYAAWSPVLVDAVLETKRKFDRVPTERLLKRLHFRNEHPITSHHPLREALVGETGSGPAQRGAFLRDFQGRAWGR